MRPLQTRAVPTRDRTPAARCAERRAARRPRFGAALIAAACLSHSFGAPRSALAQDDAQQKAAAEALFEEGRQLYAQGKLESACRRYEQSHQIDPGVGILLYLGDCYERIGKTASAWATFREAASAAHAAGQGDRSRTADERARRLAPSLSKLVVFVSPDNRSSGLQVLLDGKELSPALFGVAFAIDPGPHELSARAPGALPWSQRFEVKPGSDYRDIQIPALALAPDPPLPTRSEPYPTAGTAGPEAVPAARLEPRADSAADRQKRAGVIVGGSGVAALGVGVALGLVASSHDEEAAENCPTVCLTREAADLNSSARTYALFANLAYGLGVAALTTGTVLYFTAEPSEAPRAAWRLEPAIGPREAGVSFEGVF